MDALVQQMSKACSCAKCVQACRRFPGWMTIAEAKAMIAAGMSDKLMLDWMEPDQEKLGTDHRIYVLCPASHGCQSDHAPLMDDFYPDGGWVMALFSPDDQKPMPCVLLVDGKCSIHDSGFKPRMCRELMQCEDAGCDKYDMASEWNCEEGRSLIADWCKQHDVDLAEVDELM